MPQKVTRFCRACGAKIDAEAEICPKCGVRARLERAQKNPGVAALLSTIFAGLGQIYNEQIAKGLVFIVLAVVFAFSTLVLIGFILLPVFWVFNIYEAYNTAKKMNAGEAKPG